MYIQPGKSPGPPVSSSGLHLSASKPEKIWPYCSISSPQIFISAEQVFGHMGKGEKLPSSTVNGLQ